MYAYAFLSLILSHVYSRYLLPVWGFNFSSVYDYFGK